MQQVSALLFVLSHILGMKPNTAGQISQFLNLFTLTCLQVSEGGKPGVLNVEDPDQVNANSSENTLLAAVANHRLIIGVSAGVAVLLFILIIVVVKRCRRSSTRRVARRWDSMDYKYGKTRLYTPTNDDEDEDDDDFRDDFVENAPEQSLQTKKLINGK